MIAAATAAGAALINGVVAMPPDGPSCWLRRVLTRQRAVIIAGETWRKTLLALSIAV